MKKRTKILLIAVVMLITAGLAFGADIYVSVETGTSRGAEGTKEKPYKDLQAALDKAAIGDVVRVAAGNYLGTTDRGYLIMERPVSLIGGYDTSFTKRDVLKNRTMIQPTPAQGTTAGNNASLALGKNNGDFKVPAPGITIDGIIFDRGFSNGYHPEKGKPEGVETGIILYPPNTGMNRDQPKDVFTLKTPFITFSATPANTSGNITIQNCAFVNGGWYGIQGTFLKGKITIRNNIFVATGMAALDIMGQTSGPSPHPDAYSTVVDFSYNTVLFTWSRLSDLADMGYGYRYRLGVNTDVDHCIIGCSVLAALDRSRTDNPSGPDRGKRKTGVENTAFFLNRKGDMEVPANNTQTMMIRYNQFEDRPEEEIYKCDGNIELSGDKLKGKINEAYLKGFLSMVYSEKTDFDPNSSANQFRKAMGMNQVGTITTKVDMFGNRYPLEDALKLFGAVPNYGAQAIKN